MPADLTSSGLDLARRFVAEDQPPPGRVVLCAVTGAHLYGFPSEDSDLDLKGFHLAPTVRLLGLGAVAETHDVTAMFEGVECDLTSHELGMGLRAALKGNGNVLERITSPLQVFETEVVEELRALLPRLLSQRVHGHYAGFFRQTCRFFDREPRAKTLLYSVRVALTGIHLLRTGEVQAHLPTLAEEYAIPGVEPVIAFKRAEGEKAQLTAEAAEPLRTRWPQLESRLGEALDTSTLPPEPEGRDAADAWLVEVRRRDLLG